MNWMMFVAMVLLVLYLLFRLRTKEFDGGVYEANIKELKQRKNMLIIDIERLSSQREKLLKELVKLNTLKGKSDEEVRSILDSVMGNNK